MRTASQQSIVNAYTYLIQKGVCALDGSGQVDVESLFNRLAIIKADLETIRDNPKDTELIHRLANLALTFV